MNPVTTTHDDCVAIDAGVVEFSDPALLQREPIVSVLMLAYNHANYIREAIEGVLLQQVDFPIELVIAEDCSPDATLAIAKDYQARFPSIVRVIASSWNVGMHANHRRGASACRGKYVAYCEGDDYWTAPDKLAVQAALLDSDEATGAVHTDFDKLLWSKNERRIIKSARSTSGFVVPEGHVLDELFENFFITTCTLMVRKKFVVDYLDSILSTEKFFGVDWPLMAVVASQSKIAYIKRSMSVYRIAAGSAMNRGHVAALQRLRNIYYEQEQISSYAKISRTSVERWRIKYADALVAYSFRAGDRVAFQEGIRLEGGERGAKKKLRDKIFSACIGIKPMRALLVKVLDFKAAINSRLSSDRTP